MPVRKEVNMSVPKDKRKSGKLDVRERNIKAKENRENGHGREDT